MYGIGSLLSLSKRKKLGLNLIGEENLGEGKERGKYLCVKRHTRTNGEQRHK
ncbi:hypothetical protein LguiB_008757 [Lonicera macranthoides]